MWSRYRSRARRPAAVRRYTVWGTRPANDFVQLMYCASSSLRACTLKLPSDVLSAAFKSLKVRLSLTARALTMPSRTRSWMRRSSAAAGAGRRLGGPTGVGAGAVFRAPLSALATVPPRDDRAERDVEAAEAGGQDTVRPRRRGEQRHCPHGHETQSQQGYDARRKRPGGDDARPVAQQPRARHRGKVARAVQGQREQRAERQRRQEAQPEPPPRAGEHRVAGPARLPHQRGPSQGEGQPPLGEPDAPPRG